MPKKALDLSSFQSARRFYKTSRQDEEKIRNFLTFIFGFKT